MSHRYDDLTDYVLEKIHAGECDIAFHELENNVSQGDADSLALLGGFYIYGIGVDTDIQQGINMLEKSVQMECGDACYELWKIYSGEDQIVRTDYDIAINYLRKGMELGNSKCYGDMGCCYLNGEYVVKNPKLGYDYSKIAAEDGVPYPGFCRKEYCNVEIEDEILCAIVYIMNSNMQFYELPDRRYLEVMVEGYSDMKHDRDYIYRALEKTRHEIENMMRSGGTINIPQKNMTHSMKLRPKPFENMAIGKKTIEYRLWDEKRRLMNPGDTIVFTNTETGERLKVRIKNIYRADTFGDLKKVLVANKITSANQFSPESMRLYYSEDDEEKYGVVGIEISGE